MEISKDIPFTFGINLAKATLDKYDNHIERTLSSMKSQYLDQAAYHVMLAKDDTLLYEVYENRRPEISGELLSDCQCCIPVKWETSIL